MLKRRANPARCATPYRAVPALRASSRCSTPTGSDPAAASARTSCPRHGAPGATHIAHTLPTRRGRKKTLFCGCGRPSACLMPGNTKLAVTDVRLTPRAQPPANWVKNKKGRRAEARRLGSPWCPLRYLNVASTLAKMNRPMVSYIPTHVLSLHPKDGHAEKVPPGTIGGFLSAMLFTPTVTLTCLPTGA